MILKSFSAMIISIQAKASLKPLTREIIQIYSIDLSCEVDISLVFGVHNRHNPDLAGFRKMRHLGSRFFAQLVHSDVCLIGYLHALVCLCWAAEFFEDIGAGSKLGDVLRELIPLYSTPATNSAEFEHPDKR